MITLTKPMEVQSVAGGEGPTALTLYEKIVLSPVTYDGNALTISGRAQHISTSTPSQEILYGTFEINANMGTFKIQTPQLQWHYSRTMTAGEVNAAKGWINDQQNKLENGMVSKGVITGVQSAGI